MEDTTILIVEDENIVALDLKNKLERLGYNVLKTVSSGEEAIRLADLFYPDVILMDIMLKGDLDGIETAGRICHRFDIPIIFLTAYTDEKTLQRAKAVNPYGYISKPFKDEDIRLNIEIAVHRHQNEK